MMMNEAVMNMIVATLGHIFIQHTCSLETHYTLFGRCFGNVRAGGGVKGVGECIIG